MGMYTEIFVKVEIKDESVVKVIQHMISQDKTILEYSEIPDHSLFLKPRWQFMLNCSSYVPKAVKDFWFDEISESQWLVSRSDLKNYDQEIEAFFDWIKPYCLNVGMIGYSLYEERSEPTIYEKEA